MTRAFLFRYLFTSLFMTIAFSIMLYINYDKLPGSIYPYLILPVVPLLAVCYITYALVKTRKDSTTSTRALRTKGQRIDAEIIDILPVKYASSFFRYVVIDPANPTKQYLSDPVSGTAELVRLKLDYRAEVPDQSLFVAPLYIDPIDPSRYYVDTSVIHLDTSASPEQAVSETHKARGMTFIYLLLAVGSFVAAKYIYDLEVNIWYYIIPAVVLCLAVAKLADSLSPHSAE